MDHMKMDDLRSDVGIPNKIRIFLLSMKYKICKLNKMNKKMQMNLILILIS